LTCDIQDRPLTFSIIGDIFYILTNIFEDKS